jgi:hypothetical protein
MSNLSRRMLLTSAAALPALAVPALATEPDPILAAIENHRRRCDEYWTAHLAADIPDSWRREALEVVAKEALAVQERTAIELLHTRPTTLTGAAALLRYMVEYEERYDDQEIVGFPSSGQLAINETDRAPDWYVMRNVLALLSQVKA